MPGDMNSWHRFRSPRRNAFLPTAGWGKQSFRLSSYWCEKSSFISAKNPTLKSFSVSLFYLVKVFIMLLSKVTLTVSLLDSISLLWSFRLCQIFNDFTADCCFPVRKSGTPQKQPMNILPSGPEFHEVSEADENIFPNSMHFKSHLSSIWCMLVCVV